MSDISLPALFRRALTAASKAVNLPTVQDETQALVQSALSDLRVINSRVASLSLFSPNESIEDISSKDLVYLLVPFVLAEVEGRVKTTEPEERSSHLAQAQRFLKMFVSNLEYYNIIPESERALYEKSLSSIPDPAKRRESKIKQHKQERDLRSRIEVLQKRRRQTPVAVDHPPTDFDTIASLLPTTSSSTASQNPDADDEDDDSDTEDVLREASLLLLRLTYAQAHSQLESMDQEMALLRNIPSRSNSDRRDGKRKISGADRERQKGQDMDWRLDPPVQKGEADGRGPLLDSGGKPLRPFTILPSASSDRAKLQSQVFRPDHRLPTMSIDQYLEIERQRGNILTGGGPQSEEQPTSSEQLALDAEQDGTTLGEDKAEEKRQKDEKWARYTDEHPKGAGNTMNRG